MSPPKLSTAVIFAGGKSSRMGRDKALLPYGPFSSMAEFQYKKLSHDFDNVYLSTKEAKFPFEARLLYDRYPQSSPMVALASVFETLEEEALFILSVDMPNMGHEEIQALCAHYVDSSVQPDILIAKSPRGIEPLCGIYSRTILPEIHALLHQDIHKMKALLERVHTAYLSFETSSPFANINTPEEYKTIHP